MRQNQWGRIITIRYDRVETTPVWKYRAANAAAKSGVSSLTKSLAMEEAENGITVNMVCPGDIIGEYNIEDVRGIINDQSNSIGRPGTGEDIARVIFFL